MAMARLRATTCVGATTSRWSYRATICDQSVSSTVRASACTAQAVDGEHARSRRDPAARIGRDSVARPFAQCDGERILDRILGYVDVTKDADQGGHGSTGPLAEDPVNRGPVEL